MILPQFDLFTAIINEPLLEEGEVVGHFAQRLDKNGQSIGLDNLLILWVIDGVDFLDL